MENSVIGGRAITRNISSKFYLDIMMLIGQNVLLEHAAMG